MMELEPEGIILSEAIAASEDAEWSNNLFDAEAGTRIPPQAFIKTLYPVLYPFRELNSGLGITNLVTLRRALMICHVNSWRVLRVK